MILLSDDLDFGLASGEKSISVQLRKLKSGSFYT
jgi:hypothetical protein